MFAPLRTRFDAVARCTAGAPRSVSSAPAAEDAQAAEEVKTKSSVSPTDGTLVVVRRKNIKGSYKKLNFLTRLVSGRFVVARCGGIRAPGGTRC